MRVYHQSDALSLVNAFVWAIFYLAQYNYSQEINTDILLSSNPQSPPKFHQLSHCVLESKGLAENYELHLVVITLVPLNLNQFLGFP